MVEAPRFVTSGDAVALRDALMEWLDLHGRRPAFEEDLRAFEGDLAQGFPLAKAWLLAFVERSGDPRAQTRRHVVLEAASLLVLGARLPRTISTATTGPHRRPTRAHPRITNRSLPCASTSFSTPPSSCTSVCPPMPPEIAPRALAARTRARLDKRCPRH
jgi:hypothetical protein